MLVVGHLATQPNTGDHGSSRIYSPYIVTPMQGLRKHLGDKVEIIHISETEVEKARQLASKVDAVVIVAGNDYNDEGESVMPDAESNISQNIIIEGLQNQGMWFQAFIMRIVLGAMMNSYTSTDGSAVGGDRQNLSLKPSEISVIQAIGKINPKTIVALVGGSAILTHEWDADVPAILYAWYAGMEGGNALARILFGDMNPSGKLPFSIASDPTHYPYFSSTDSEITYDLYHGYSYMDKAEVEAAYPFGFGLSYTQWAYDNVRLTNDGDQIHVTVNLSNIGQRTGEEVVQVYVGMQNSQIERQHKLLKGFEKITLSATQSSDVTITINKDELRYFDEASNAWQFEQGRYTFWVGSSSQTTDLISAEITLE